MHRIIHTIFTLFHFNFCGTTYADNGYTASQFCQTLIQLFAIIVRCGFFCLRANLGTTCFDIFAVTKTVHNGGFFLGNFHTLGCTQHVQCDTVQLDANFF